MRTRTKIFLILFLSYAFFTNTYLTTSDASRFSLTAAIAEEQDLHIDDFLGKVISYWWLPKDYAVYNDHLYSDKAPLGSFLGVPTYLIVSIFTKDLAVLTYFVSLFTAGLLTAATAVLIYNIGEYFTNKKEIRVALSLSYGLGTAAFFYGTIFFSHAITAFFGFASFYLLFKSKHSLVNKRELALSGIFAALIISSDYYAGLISVALFIYGLNAHGKKMYIFISPFLATILLLLTYQWSAFGDPFTIPYLYSNLYSEHHMFGFYGVRGPDMVFLSNLFSKLFSPWGFFFTSPLALLSFVSLPRFSKKYRSETAMVLFITVGLFTVTGSIARFDAYSVRFLVPLVPFLFVPLYTLDYDKRKVKLSFYSLAFISLIINFAGVDTFLPEIVQPSIIRATYGNHNIVGEFLIRRGINLHFLTHFPLIVFYITLWKKSVKSILDL